MVQNRHVADRWAGVVRPYSPADVRRLRGTFHVAHTLAELGARRLWDLLHTRPYVSAVRARTEDQALALVRAGREVVHVRGGPTHVRRVNRALRRADQLEHGAGGPRRYWLAPIVADTDAREPDDVFELVTAGVEAGAAGVQLRDRRSREDLVPIGPFVAALVAARLAADVADVPLLVVARTDARGPTALARARAYAPYADVIGFGTGDLDPDAARAFAVAIHAEHPGKPLACDGSGGPWKADDPGVAAAQRELGAMGYVLHLVTPTAEPAGELASARLGVDGLASTMARSSPRA